MYEGNAIGGKSALAGAQKAQKVTDQLLDCRDALQKLYTRMDDLIDRTGVNVVNEIKAESSQTECPQAQNTRAVTIDLQTLCERLHRKMDTLDSIA